MNPQPLGRFSTATALVLTAASMLLYSGGTCLDAQTRGYSFTHNFLSDLGSTVTFNGVGNATGAVLFAVSVAIMVLALAVCFVAAVRVLSATPGARPLARLAAIARMLVCAGFLGVALTPENRAMRLHMVSGMLAFRSFVVATALLAIATLRDRRFRARAAVGWVTLTIVLAGFIAMTHVGPTVDTDGGLMTQVVTQTIMAATVLVVIWLEGRETEAASAR